MKVTESEILLTLLNKEWRSFYCRYRLKQALREGMDPNVDAFLRGMRVSEVERRKGMLQNGVKTTMEFMYRLHCTSVFGQETLHFTITDASDREGECWVWKLKDPSLQLEPIDETSFATELAGCLPLSSVLGEQLPFEQMDRAEEQLQNVLGFEEFQLLRKVGRIFQDLGDSEAK